MRAILLSALLLAAAASPAFADASVAGDWRASLGNNVTIRMHVDPDGNWSSQTLQRGRTVREMSGTYQQTKAGPDQGTLVFMPTQARTQSGTVTTETDQYQLAQNGRELKLTSDGDTITFRKQQQ